MPLMHIPGYNYCWPVTRLDERLAISNAPGNKLGAGYKKYDIFYRDHKDTKEWLIDDKELANIAKERMRTSDASFGEKLSSAMVRTIVNIR